MAPNVTTAQAELSSANPASVARSYLRARQATAATIAIATTVRAPPIEPPPCTAVLRVRSWVSHTGLGEPANPTALRPKESPCDADRLPVSSRVKLPGRVVSSWITAGSQHTTSTAVPDTNHRSRSGRRRTTPTQGATATNATERTAKNTSVCAAADAVNASTGHQPTDPVATIQASTRLVTTKGMA